MITRKRYLGLELKNAIRKMTSAVADRQSLHDRGTLGAGCYAYIIVFNSETVGDRETCKEPHQRSADIHDV